MQTVITHRCADAKRSLPARPGLETTGLGCKCARRKLAIPQGRIECSKPALLIALLVLLLVGWARVARAQSCGEAGGDYCSQSGSCPAGYNSLGQTWDCNPCCESVPQGPSCGALGGNWCSQGGGCPAGYDSLGQTYDCNPCCRQRSQGQMSFSVYTGSGVAGDSVYVNSTVIDNSQGCSHSGYLTTSRIVSPTNRTSSSTSSGLSASTSLAINGEDGDYQTSTIGIYDCTCLDGPGGYNGGGPINVKAFTAVFQKDHRDDRIGKWVYEKRDYICNGVCQPVRWCSTQECDWLYAKGYKVTTGFGFATCELTPPYPRCASTQPQCRQQFGYNILGPDDECHN